MEYYDHAMLGAVVALATGTQRKYGLPVVATASLAAALPDWDAVPYPKGTPSYRLVHRVWGHNLLVATLASSLIGAIGYLCWQSARRGPPADSVKPRRFSAQALAVWVVVVILASLSHLLADVCYSGPGYLPEMPVALLWPFSHYSVALPLVPWTDRGVTWILGVTLAAACFRPAASRLLAIVGLVVVIGYIALHRILALGF